ncbi:response regulator transcription factor [Sphingobacterium psychroaquaticum]|uniref:DNA-binding response regulator, OmpR family, contains REC and winged-helix (WHTH) domain n=1 Tax=Sphingobacterium psychroaquaticum TaxID=561061 RepID=A0A1X7J3M9_9SPHI|nr:response regulator transcription factor [Sphingobacterium psychroaquaticum]QBQ40171.1 response regulator transcription factor [Sphingobacterium psychroaquaticum]SMG21419.1 DNA-binding response regulator, OmpR family, contains REC and winged-helix (wHTH) domain [Sphingobacterium psychroaquaticum]
MKGTILLIEDDLDLGKQTQMFLESSGFNVAHAMDGRSAVHFFDNQKFDLLVVDIQMPDADGFDLVSSFLDRFPDQRFLFLTARNTRESKLKGLQLGGDDYITKPFDVEELSWRIHNILNRAAAADTTSLSVADVRLDMALMEVSFDRGHRLTLTSREYDLWKYFLTHPNTVLKREEILLDVWGENDYFLGRSLDVYIARMRKQLQFSSYLTLNTVFKVGFVLKTAATD